MGGYAHFATLIARLRAEAGASNTILLDGGDSWQGSWVAHDTQGAGMVRLANLLGVDAMTSHWEMCYGEAAFRANLGKLKATYPRAERLLDRRGGVQRRAGVRRRYRPRVPPAT